MEKLNQIEISFREIMSMREEGELDDEQFITLLLDLDIEKVVTVNAEELQKKEQLMDIISEELRKTE